MRKTKCSPLSECRKEGIVDNNISHTAYCTAGWSANNVVLTKPE